MNHDHDTCFDQAMRRVHAEALAHVSANTQARLRSARHAAAAQAPPRQGLRWAVAGGVAAVFALAVGLQWQAPSPQPAPPAATAMAAATETPAHDYGGAVAVLDENPDLYLWLASNDDALPPVSE